jgi:hypothetical protein
VFTGTGDDDRSIHCKRRLQLQLDVNLAQSTSRSWTKQKTETKNQGSFSEFSRRRPERICSLPVIALVSLLLQNLGFTKGKIKIEL